MDKYFKCINFGKVKCIVCDRLSSSITCALGRALDWRFMESGFKSHSGQSWFLPSHYIWCCNQPMEQTGLILPEEKTCDVDLQDHLKGGRKVMGRPVWTVGTRLAQLAKYLTRVQGLGFKSWSGSSFFSPILLHLNE